MGLSLKQAEMDKFLAEAKQPEETINHALWGTVYAKLPAFTGRTLMSMVMIFTPAPGVSGTLNNAFCYIGLTDQNLYVIALDAYNTSKIIGTFAFPLAKITSLKTHKNLMGSYVIEVECEGFATINVKATSIGTDIKDQKQRMTDFLAAIQRLER